MSSGLKPPRRLRWSAVLDRALHDTSFVLDAHTHGVGFLPRPVDALYRRIAPTRPAETSFAALPNAGVDAVVAKAVGDGVVTRWRPTEGSWRSVVRQLGDLRRQAEADGCRVVDQPAELASPGTSDRPAVLLGLEGADPVGEDPSRIDELHRLGVRVVGLVHYVDNALGSVCMPWRDWVPVPIPARRRRRPGLTPLGAEVIERMNGLGMVVDLAHADRATTLAACERSRAPVISSHTGARALGDFARFIGDDEARAIAETGGLLGLWPFFYRGKGVADLDDFARHASHFGNLVGPEHLCIGTDMNGVSGHTHGFRDERDFPALTDTLRRTGFSDDEVRGIVGGNMLRVLAAAAREE